MKSLSVTVTQAQVRNTRATLFCVTLLRAVDEKRGRILPPRTGGSVVEHRAVTREVVSSTPAGPTLRVLK